jgi:hypothetical protein
LGGHSGSAASKGSGRGGRHARGEFGLDVEDDPDRWVPPVSGKAKNKRKEKKGKEVGCCGLWSAGLTWAVCPGLAQLGRCPFFILFFCFWFPLDFGVQTYLKTNPLKR